MNEILLKVFYISFHSKKGSLRKELIKTRHSPLVDLSMSEDLVMKKKNQM